jgi:hypothetical protein
MATQRGGAGVRLDRPGVEAGNRAALPDLDPADVVGSPYCVRDYVVDEQLGGPAALATARAQLAARGIGLILDFVPSYVAPGHAWAAQRLNFFIRGTPDDLAASPQEFVQMADGITPRAATPTLLPGATSFSSTRSRQS